MDKALLYLIMDVITKAPGKTIRCQGMADLSVPVAFTKDKSEKVRHMEKVLTRTLKEHIMVSGEMIKGTALVRSNSKKGRKESMSVCS